MNASIRCLALTLLVALPSVTVAANETTNPRTGAPASWPEPVPSMRFGQFLIDRLEAGFADAEDSNVWDAQGWYGGDVHKGWLKTEGEGAQGKPLESAELQLGYGRMFSRFWDLQIGLRHDFRPDPDRTFLAVGVQGLAPYFFELDAATFVSDDGDVSLRVEAEYELLLTQRLILQPRFELNAAIQAVESIGIGSGVNTTETGLRLRYEISRKFGPYVGFSWTQRYGETADLARAEGGATSVNALVVGVRAWF